MNLKKNENGDRTIILTMPQACLLIIAALAGDPRTIQRAVRNIAYYQKSNAKAFRSHRRRRLKSSA